MAKRHHLPPIPFLLVGALLLLSVALLGIFWIIAAFTGTQVLVSSESELQEALAGTAVIAVITLLWVLTLARLRWARIGLMLFAITAAAHDLISTTATGQISASGLLSAAISMLILWAINADSMRAWVEEKPRKIQK